MKIPEKIPEWLASLPKDALLGANDLCQMFGYKHNESLSASMKNGGAKIIPNHDHEFVRGNDSSKTGYTKTYYWKASTIRNFIRQHNRK